VRRGEAMQARRPVDNETRPSKKRLQHAKKISGRFMDFVRMEAPLQEKIETIRRGVPAGEIENMVEYLDVSKSDVFKVLAMPGSTGHALIRNKRRLDRGSSERVVRVAEIARAAERTFGDHEAAARWLKSENRALAGVTPLSMLDTSLGAVEVRRILSSIDFGGVL
jgi:putative toxin-antitoxin system antitoxin component (TIGR02293 family)